MIFYQNAFQSLKKETEKGRYRKLQIISKIFRNEKTR